MLMEGSADETTSSSSSSVAATLRVDEAVRSSDESPMLMEELL